MLMIHKPKCENYDTTSIRISSDSHLHWKDDFHRNPLSFGINADFEADNEIGDGKAVCNETNNIYKQNPIFNGYHIKSELDDLLQSG